jgi:cell division protein FtsA
MPVRIGVPTGIYGLADILPDPTFATGVGLLLWGANQQEGTQGWKTQGLGESFKRFVVRMRNLVAK